MSAKFCPKCGRPRTSSRFCGGCGNDFGEQAADSGTAPALVAQPLGDASANATPVETPAAAPVWETTDTIYAQPASAPPSPPAPASPASPGSPASPAPAVPWTPGRPPGNGKRVAFIIAAVLVVLAAGGGAYALVARSHPQTTAQPPTHPTVTAHASTAPAVQASTSPTTSASASPSTAPSASATPSPTRTGTAQAGTVQAAAGVASNPAAPRVEAFLNRYFNSINTRNYGEHNSLLDAQGQQADSQSTFDSGYATTKDSKEVLTGLTDTGGGSLTANVSFTSHQNPADSPDQSACDDWQISVYLVPQGASYVMTAAPAGYTASDTAC